MAVTVMAWEDSRRSIFRFHSSPTRTSASAVAARAAPLTSAARCFSASVRRSSISVCSAKRSPRACAMAASISESCDAWRFLTARPRACCAEARSEAIVDDIAAACSCSSATTLCCSFCSRRAASDFHHRPCCSDRSRAARYLLISESNSLCCALYNPRAARSCAWSAVLSWVICTSVSEIVRCSPATCALRAEIPASYVCLSAAMSASMRMRICSSSATFPAVTASSEFFKTRLWISCSSTVTRAL
mmetsp:Transcript_26773/g.42874  ORF Transcript_26773/g.42874 Transcript_26773/m.42874 type:complete len:247 (-) Transcript_26773:50-790(-)